MNTKTVHELRSIAKDKGIHGYYKLNKNDLLALLLEQSAEEMLAPPPRGKGKKRRSVASLELHDVAKKTLKGDVEDEAERENEGEEEDVDSTPHEHERALKGAYRSVVMSGTPKTDIDSYFDQAKTHIKTLIENQLKELGSAKIIMTLWVRWKKPIKQVIELDPDDLEDAHDKEGNAGDKGRPVPLVNPSPQKMDEFEKEEVKKSKSLVKNTLNEWYDWLVDHVPKQIKNAASKKFLELKNSILKLYDGVKKTLNEQTEDNTPHKNDWGKYIRVEMPFNNLLTEFFEGSDINDLMQRMLAYIKTQVENLRMPDSGFSLDKLMHLYINFHRLVLTRGSAYTELPKWIKSKKVVINPQNKDEKYFK